MASMSETLKDAIRDSGQTVYRISKDSGLDYDSIYRFLSGRTSLRLDKADKLAAYFGIRCSRPRRRKGK